MKRKVWIYSLTIVGISLIMLTACKKKDTNNDDNNNPPPVTTVTDVDGNVYNTIIIGTQTWMKENLKVTHYRNGDAIPKITDGAQWQDLTGAYCDYDNTPSNSSIYGNLYNWYAVHDSRNIAPVGWHVASKVEWTTLIAYLGGDNVAGGKLKETGTTHWISPNDGATNETGFTALPGGTCSSAWGFTGMGYGGSWWSSLESTTDYAWKFSMFHNQPYASNADEDKNNGYSVRCVKD